MSTIVVLGLGLPTPLGPPHLGMTVVSGDSMLPTYDPNDLVVTWRQDEYPVGTPVVYRIPADQAGAGYNVVHRIVEAKPDGTFATQGDNNDFVDPWNPRPSDVRGKIVLRVPQGGRALLLFSSPFLLAVVSGVLMGYAVYGWSKQKDPPDPDAGGGGKPRRWRSRKHRKPTPVAPRVALTAVAAALLVGVTPAFAAGLGPLTSGDIFTKHVPAALAQNPVSYEQTLTSDNPLQYCATVVVTNHSAQAVNWEITLNISQAPYNAIALASSYNVTTVAFSLTTWRVKGVAFNQTLAAGASYTWGYCGTRAEPSLVDATTTSVAINSVNASEYCATVTVTSTSPTYVRWRAAIARTTTGVTDPTYWLAGAPTSGSNFTSISFDGTSNTWYVRGVASNEYIKSGTNATFNYCAPAGAAIPYVDATLSVSVTSFSAAQYCATVTVSTTSPTNIKWQATINHSTPGLSSEVYWITAEPTPNNGVTQSFTAATGTWVVRGQSYNQLINASSPASFSFCASTNPNAGLVAADVAVSVSSSSPTNYCVNVTVSTTSADWIKWKASISQATPNLPATPAFTGAPTNFWNVTQVSFTAGVWTVSGVGWNDLIKAGSPQTFGFCKP